MSSKSNVVKIFRNWGQKSSTSFSSVWHRTKHRKQSCSLSFLEFFSKFQFFLLSRDMFCLKIKIYLQDVDWYKNQSTSCKYVLWRLEKRGKSHNMFNFWTILSTLSVTLLLKYYWNTLVYKWFCIPQLRRSKTKKIMARRQNETSWLKHHTLCDIQSTEVFLSGFNALCTFSHEEDKNEVKMKNDNYRNNVNTRHRDEGRQTNENITLKIKSKCATPIPKINLQVYTSTMKGLTIYASCKTISVLGQSQTN
jgi:hypothetical protein